MSLTSDFSSWFKSNWGDEPFPWQASLAMRGQFPDCIGIPTGLGKTSTLDIWLWQMLSGRVVPRRMWYIVDRRCLVDSTYQHAQKLVEKTGADVRTLCLRGGVYERDDLPLSPDQPAIICSTVDQFGSRLLGRGYGCGAGQRMYHMGLAGNDSLVVVDEAHISQPLLQTVASCRDLGADLQLVPMTATPPEGNTDVLRLSDADRQNSVVQQRINAIKSAALGKGTLASNATKLHRAGAKSLAVFANTVDSAIAAADALRKQKGDVPVVLVTGRQRECDREAIIAEWSGQLKSGQQNTPEVYVVTTQALEVGVDWDFCGIVTECSDMSSLRQRFGRLDRTGWRGTTSAVIVKPTTKSVGIYGESAKRTWEYLGGIATDMVVDFGIATSLGWDVPAECVMPPLDAPLLTSTQLDQWSLSDLVGEDPSMWLHGDQDEIHCRVCWRDGDMSSPVHVTLAPPVMAETAPVSVNLLRKTLEDRPVTIWRGEASELPANQVRPGDVVVIPVDPDYDCRELACLSEDDSLDVLEQVAPVRRVRSDGNAMTAYDSLSDDCRELLGPGYVTNSSPNGWVFAARRVPKYRTPKRPVTLADHTESVAGLARAVAENVCPEHADRIETAARYHDLGKLDPRFQRWLGANGKPLAKSDQSPAVVRSRRLASGYPRGRRHEYLSTAIAAAEGQDDLTLFLIEGHHGHTRGSFSHEPDAFPVMVQDKKIMADAEVYDVERFWRLLDEHGYWGVPRIMSVLMYADWQTSLEEQL